MIRLPSTLNASLRSEARSLQMSCIKTRYNADIRGGSISESPTKWLAATHMMLGSLSKECGYEFAAINCPPITGELHGQGREACTLEGNPPQPRRPGPFWRRWRYWHHRVPRVGAV